jgi:hypothetical protein
MSYGKNGKLYSIEGTEFNVDEFNVDVFTL